MYRYLLVIGFVLFLSAYIHAQDTICIDFANIVRKDIPSGASSANLCWLINSDLKRPNPHKSFIRAIDELGSGSLRFPYGHLADNYLWHTPPYTDTEKGLRPRVASMSQAPGQWEWAVNKNGTFKSAMDFDEFMGICQKLDIKPLVVVNIFSFKYEGGPTLPALVEAAVEWVKYAKEKGYKVAYWQIGNEVDHHPELMAREEYVNAYMTIVSAMKKVDPSIKAGPGILSNVTFFKSIINQYPDLIDFTSCHQYMWSFIESCKTYERWKDVDDLFIPNVLKMQDAVTHSVKPDMEIVITETGVSPSGKEMGSINNTWKALWWFEVLMNELAQPNVTYSYFWGTHSPWNGTKDNEEDDVGVLFAMGDNSRKPIAEVSKIVNENILDNMAQASQATAYIRTFAGISDREDKSNIFLMNKNNKKQDVVLSLGHLPKNIKQFARIELKGKKPDDRTVEIINEDNVVIKGGKEVKLVLPPLSITILRN